MTDFNPMIDAIVSCDSNKVTELVNAALSEDVLADEILNNGLISGMDIVGEKMESGDMFIPEVLMAAQAMGNYVAILKPLLGDDESTTSASVIIGTVKGDPHDIGKILVTMMMDAGMDSAIIDPLDKKIMATIRTADMLLNHDDYCMNFLNGVRSRAIES